MLVFVDFMLLDMGMIVDMVNAVAEVSGAFGAVAEFQIRTVCIGSSADGAFVTIRTLTGGTAIFICPVWIRLCICFGRRNRLLSADFVSPGK